TRVASSRLAARATEAPIRPVPTTARRRMDTSELGSGGPAAVHQLGDAEGEVERLARVQAWVAERPVAVVELLLQHRFGAAEALGDGFARELEVHAAGPDADPAARLEEPFDLVHDHVEAARLVTGLGLEHVRVHGVAGPHDRMLRLAHGAQERRQRLPHPVRAHARDERQPAGNSARVEALAKLGPTATPDEVDPSLQPTGLCTPEKNSTCAPSNW